MAREIRTATGPVALEQDLADRPYKHGFYQVLRRLECAYTDKPRLGRSQRPADDPIRLGQEPTLCFPPSALASFKPGSEGLPPRLSVFFFGLFGANGPLPHHLTEYARDRERNSSDSTLIRFADIFHHRLLSLFYRAWADAQPTVNFDRPESDRFAAYIGATFGLALESLRNRDAVPDLAKLHQAGRLSCRTRHAEGLGAVIEDYFGLRARVQQFVGEWLEIPEDSCWRLGESPSTGSLGTTATIGGRVWSCQHKFRIEFGPLRYADYQRLLPGSKSLERLVSLVRNYAGDEYAWDVQLILAKDEVPPAKLGGEQRLGLTTWLIGERARHDAADLFLDPVAETA